MGRQRVIDRNHVLDMAEQIVRTSGVASLTIGTVAEAAGISKGGVQSSFGTKNQLIDAMFARWWKEFDGAVSERAGVDPSPLTALQAHIDVTRAATENVTDRTASLMAALLQIDAQRQTTRDWYRVRMDLADPSTAEGKRLRLALLATEGAFLLRSLDLLRMDETEWHAIFGDIQALLLAP